MAYNMAGPNEQTLDKFETYKYTGIPRSALGVL